MDRFTALIYPRTVQAVLADPVLLRAVDPHVLQAVLVQAATANLQLELDTSHHQLQLPSFPATPPHLNISAHPALPRTMPMPVLPGPGCTPLRTPQTTHHNSAGHTPYHG